MAKSTKEINDYINLLPEDRVLSFKKLRDIIASTIPKGFEECMNYNMPSFVIPHSLYPNGYHCDKSLPLPFVSIASQKNFIALYHMGIYANADLLKWFQTEYSKHCKSKLDMGKSCIRFKKMDDIPFELIAELMQKMTVKNWIELYEKNIKG